MPRGTVADLYSSTVTPAEFADELFLGHGVSQMFGPRIDDDVLIDVSQWGLHAGDTITIRSSGVVQTQRNGVWVEEHDGIQIDVDGGSGSGTQYNISYVDAGSTVTKIRLPKPVQFYTGQGTHALLVNGQPVIDGTPLHTQADYLQAFGQSRSRPLGGPLEAVLEPLGVRFWGPLGPLLGLLEPSWDHLRPSRGGKLEISVRGPPL